MPSFNGHLASLTLSGTTAAGQVFGATGAQTVNVDPAVAHKYFSRGVGAVRVVDGVSGGFGLQVLGSVGGATFVIGGITAISTVGNFIIGMTGAAVVGSGFPRPTKVVFESAGAITAFTASVYLTGEY